MLNDLAIAYLMVAERNGRLRTMLQSLDAIDRALVKDSAFLPALFNRALILERLYMRKGARDAWARYLSAERSTDWQREATAHLHRLDERVDGAGSLPSIESLVGRYDSETRRTLASCARRTPQRARDLGFSLLGEWGRAHAKGRASEASGLISLAEAIAASLDSLGADRSLAVEVQAIRSHPERAAAFARAHIDLDDGRRLFAESSFEDALVLLSSAEDGLRAVGSHAADWAAYYRAASLVSRGEYSAGDRVFHLVLERASPEEEPALLGKAMLALGVSQLRRGNYERAIAWYQQAKTYVVRSRDEETSGFAAYLLGEALDYAGQTSSSETESYQALRLLSASRTSAYLYNEVARVAEDARAQGLKHASISIMNDVIDVARQLNRPDLLAPALCSRARDLAALGETRAASADLAEAEQWVQRMRSGRGLDRVRASVLLTRGAIMSQDDPAGALPTLMRAVDTFRSFQTDLFLPEALYEAAQSARAIGDNARARVWIDEAIVSVERQGSQFRTGERRIAFSETIERVFDAMIDIEMRAGRPGTAFEYAERARAAAASPAMGARESIAPPVRRVSLAGLQSQLPNDMLVVEYAVLRDRLIAWTATRGRWHHASFGFGRDSLIHLVNRALEDIEQDRATGSAALETLFDLLIRPLSRDLAGITRVAVVPDRDLYRVPFAALRDRDNGRYAVETYELSTLPSAAFLIEALGSARAHRASGPALIVGNPLLDAMHAAELGDLAGAASEAQAVSAYYPRVKLLVGRDARRGTVLELLSRSSVFHFAGHAVFDNERPEFSYLALAPDGGDADGLLEAWEIARLRLSNLRLVVLSACSTLSPRATRNGALSGIAHSFLRAGVPATISTLWDIPDEATGELVATLHRYLTSNQSASGALRLAQLGALASPVERLRSPRYWAAFTYTGP